jgi:hypothetical protein
METINFKNIEYKITETLPVTPMLAASGLQAQHIVIGKRGATRLFQIWQAKHGQVWRMISLGGKTEEMLAA